MMNPKDFTTYAAYRQRMMQEADGCVKEVKALLARIEDSASLRAFVHTYPEEAVAKAMEVDAKLAKGEAGALAGMVVGLKDVFCYAGHPVTASSAMLKGFVSQITATAIDRVLGEDAIIVGHQSCDEFAMGSSNEHSVYGPVEHPLDPAFIPGGSSGGSAAAVASGLCHVALGTDTGGSVRQPAAWCGVIGFKPTYARISRYGVIEFASSFDTVSIFARGIEDCARMLEVMAGQDRYDNTSSGEAVPRYTDLLAWDTKANVAYVKEALDHPALSEDVKAPTLGLLDTMRQAGHRLEAVDFPLLDYALPTYHCLTTAEASANLARYDGIRYGQRSEEARTLEEVYTKTRTEMFGDEVKKRILLGTFVLSAGYYDDYYTRAQKVRHLIKAHMEKVLETYDFVVLPTTPTTAMRRGTMGQDPLREYLSDLYTVLAPLAGFPAISIPNGTNAQGWPVGFQIIGKPFKEAELLAFAKYLMETKAA